jgi:hypothetical protein
MTKAFKIALSLAVAAPLVMSTAAIAQNDMRHDDSGMQSSGSSGMQKSGKTAKHHAASHRQGASQPKNRSARNRDEAKVTSELNQQQLNSNR